VVATCGQLDQEPLAEAIMGRGQEKDFHGDLSSFDHVLLDDRWRFGFRSLANELNCSEASVAKNDDFDKSGAALLWRLHLNLGKRQGRA
jgi:hypothetical protein